MAETSLNLTIGPIFPRRERPNFGLDLTLKRPELLNETKDTDQIYDKVYVAIDGFLFDPSKYRGPDLTTCDNPQKGCVKD